MIVGAGRFVQCIKAGPYATKAGEPRQDLAPRERPDLAGGALDDGRAHRNLAVAGDDDLALVADGKDGSGSNDRLFHGSGISQRGRNRPKQ